MRVAYLDCASGISGDMTLGALVDAGVDLERIREGVASLGLPQCKLVATTVKKHGFRATQISVEHPPEHKHRHLHHIEAMIAGSTLTEPQKALARKIFGRLAAAEAKVHGTTIEKVHFHEVGAIDSIADIVGAAIGWDLLGVDRVAASPVPTGRGSITIAHGVCSLPAPATGELLRGIPLAPCDVEAELTTPTGAAILASLVDEFGALPAMTIEQIGYGAGQRDLADRPNLLRLLVGKAAEDQTQDTVWVIETNLDTVTGETIGYTTEALWQAGALEVYTTAIAMKKNRPGIKLTVLCPAASLSEIEAVLFRETGTLGVRRWQAQRHKLARAAHVVATAFGMIEGKLAWSAGNVPSFAPEYEACRLAAQRAAVPLRTVYLAAQQAFDPRGLTPPASTAR